MEGFVKEKNVKKLFVWGILSCVFLCAFFFLAWYLYDSNKADEYLKTLAQKADGNEMDIIVYGNLKDTKKATINFRRTECLNQESIEGFSPNSYHLVILSDIDGKLSISDEELILLREYCESKHYDMFYVGEAHMEQMVRCGFDTKVLPGECSLYFCGYQFKNGCPYTFNGESWINPEEPDTYYANPYIWLTDIKEEDLEEFQNDSSKLWELILELTVGTKEKY